MAMLGAFDYSYWAKPLATDFSLFMSLNIPLLKLAYGHGISALRSAQTLFVGVCLSFLLWSTTLAAASDIYTAKVTLSETVTETEAINEALLSVITELTGSVNSRQIQVVQQALQSAEDYVSHIATLKQDDDQPVLQIRFDQAAIDQLLRQAGLPIWGTERANLIAWLVIEKQGLQEVISDDGHEEAVVLRQQAEIRGIPLVLPLMDLTDQSSVSMSDIGGRFWQPIEEASQRYQAQGIIIGRIYQTIDSYWHAQGQLNLPDGIEAWQLQAAELDILLSNLTEKVAVMLVQRYALQTDSHTNNQLLLQVQGVADLQSYADLLRVLASVSSVTDVSLVSLQGNTVQLRVTHQGQAKKLLLSLQLESRLTLLDGQQANAYSASQSAHTAYYQWQ